MVDDKKEREQNEHDNKVDGAEEADSTEVVSGADPILDDGAHITQTEEPSVHGEAETDEADLELVADSVEGQPEAETETESEAQADLGPESNDKPERTAVKESTPMRTRVWASAVLVLVLIFGVAAAGGLVYLHKQIQTIRQQADGTPEVLPDETAHAKISELQSQLSLMKESLQDQQRRIENQKAPADISPLKKQINDMRQQLKSVSGQHQSVEDQIAQLQTRVDGHQNRFISLTSTSREDWKLAEAEYLLKLANQRVLLERSPVNAIALLEATDEIIKEVADGLGDPELFAIRKALNKELTALRLVIPIDREGIYLELEALADESELFNKHRGSPFLDDTDAQPNTSTDSAEDKGWWAKIKSLAADMNQYIRVQPQDAPENPLIGVYESQLKTLNLRILIQQAQVALLKEQPTVYQSGLNRAQKLIETHFADTDIAGPYLKRLSTLNSKPIAQDLPDISKSLKLLHSYVARTHQLSDSKVSAL